MNVNMGMLATALLLLVTAPSESEHVLLVVNGWSKPGMEIGKYYAAKRAVPKANVIYLETPPEEEIGFERYQKDIQQPVAKALARLKGKIDFIVLTKDVPMRFSDKGFQGGYSLDAYLALHEKPLPFVESTEDSSFGKIKNPYFRKQEPFKHSKFGFYLVTRLDGYTESDVKRMIDNSVRAAGAKGLFLFDEAENRKSGDYLETQKGLSAAATLLKSRGFQVSLDTTATFVAPPEPIMGYASWGSNDGAFSLDAYRRLRFQPGSIAETFVSTSGRTFRRTSGGQSLIADLIEQGLTGAKGYVSEPFTIALARPEILFDRYTSGFNLAESSYMASPLVGWKDVVVGDPLCRPYRRAGK
ncbi:MAG: TIGR03790 family protein [Fimbriimonas sp.]